MSEEAAEGCCTLQSFATKWETLQALGRAASRDAAVTHADTVEDPFDCSDMIIPSTTVVAEQTATEFVRKWRDLDSRKVSHERRPHWYEHHVRLPEGFSLDGPVTADSDDDDNQDRVVSLENPAESTSYARALSELFQTIPTAATIEADAMADHALPQTAAVWKDMMNNTSVRPDPRLALERLRVNDLHDPMDGTQHVASNHSVDTTPVVALRFEFLRDPPARGFRSDPYRIVLEFSSSQTLLDVHTALCALDPDHCWKQSQPTTTGADSDNPRTEPGFFFIEGNFYTTPGDTVAETYTTPIIKWLDNPYGPRSSRGRRKELGLDPEAEFDTIYAMPETPLAQLACRIGVRYCHVRNGSLETAVFVTDRRIVPDDSTARWPILHDVNVFVHALPACDACGRHDGSAGTCVTSTTCEATGGHRVLCSACCTALQLTNNDVVRPYITWRGEADRVGV